MLGTTCTITVYGSGNQEALEAAFRRVEEIENLMSANIAESDISRINRAAGIGAVEVSPETFEVVRTGVDIGRSTDNALDIAIGPLVKLWGIGSQDAAVPDEGRVAELLQLISPDDIVLNEEEMSVYLEKPGMALDVGAVAKGYAADETARVLGDAGVDRAIVDFGGNIKVVGHKPGREPWKVGIQDPFGDRGGYFGILSIPSGSVVSSGTYERFFEEDGKRYHHILDSSTGFPAESGIESVSVWTEDSFLADALSTALFVLGVDRGIEYLNTLDTAAEAIFVTNSRQVIVTPELEKRFSVTDPDFSLAR